MKRPVFVVGCPRSGTTLLYSMLIAAGGFAVYRKETHVYTLAPAIGALTTPRAKARFLQSFLGGYLGAFPGQNVRPFAESAVSEARSAQEFLPLFMSALARQQGAERWVEATPTHVLRLGEIKKAVPDALFVHVIRDGRDCALSLSGQPWRPRAPWQRSGTTAVAALFWEWMVRAGQEAGRRLSSSYVEVRFEDLIDRPAETLAQLGPFIDHDLDYDRIRRNEVHALLNPNSTFKKERGPSFYPVGRARRREWAAAMAECEQVVGPYLRHLGYQLLYATDVGYSARARVIRAAYLNYLAVKDRLQTHPFAARYVVRFGVWARQPHPQEQPLGRRRRPAMD